MASLYGPYYCKICQIATNGPEPYAQHNRSAKHLKKASLGPPFVASANLGSLILTPEEMVMCGLLTQPPLKVAPKVYPISIPASPLSGSNYFCKVCCVSMSGPDPYQQHMSSPKHMKKAISDSALSSTMAPTPYNSATSCVRLPAALEVDSSTDLALQKTLLKDVVIILHNEKIKNYLPQLCF